MYSVSKSHHTMNMLIGLVVLVVLVALYFAYKTLPQSAKSPFMVGDPVEYVLFASNYPDVCVDDVASAISFKGVVAAIDESKQVARPMWLSMSTTGNPRCNEGKNMLWRKSTEAKPESIAWNATYMGSDSAAPTYFPLPLWFPYDKLRKASY